MNKNATFINSNTHKLVPLVTIKQTADGRKYDDLFPCYAWKERGKNL
jgi:hypothetical protein